MHDTVYPEIVGFLSRNREIGPPQFPDACPICGAKITDASREDELSAFASYACGGGYTIKPQIQNHTRIWWGVCESTTHMEPTYTARWSDTRRVIYLSQPHGNLFGHLPLGTMPLALGSPDPNADQWDGAIFACEGRRIEVKRDREHHDAPPEFTADANEAFNGKS